jgi:hypothetical protein
MLDHFKGHAHAEILPPGGYSSSLKSCALQASGARQIHTGHKSARLPEAAAVQQTPEFAPLKDAAEFKNILAGMNPSP